MTANAYDSYKMIVKLIYHEFSSKIHRCCHDQTKCYHHHFRDPTVQTHTHYYIYFRRCVWQVQRLRVTAAAHAEQGESD